MLVAPMIKVKNGAIIRRLSSRSLKRARSRNIIAICAIVLTCLLFTGLLTVGMSMLEFMQEQTMRQIGTSAHGGFKLLTQEQFDKVAADPAVKQIAYSTIVGELQTPQLNKLYTELRYSEESYAKWSFCSPTTGRLPQKGKELACSEQVLDALQIPHELGAQVELEFTVGDAAYRDTFTLCGFWPGDAVGMAQTVLISKDYSEQVAPMPDIDYFEQDNPRFVYGYKNPVFFFSSAWDIESQVQALKDRCGFEDRVMEGINWAYGASSVDWQTVAVIAGILALIILSGYLIIYNIFSISVTRDIQFYGLLKTIGATGRQLKKLVHHQALLLSSIGVPVGLLLGWLCGRFLMPMMLNATSYARQISSVSTSVSPLIFLGGAALSLVTVYISCIRPCRIAAGVSPMEAVRYTDALGPVKRRSKKTAAVSPFSMARANLRRTPGKTRIVVLSLSLSLILFNGVYTLVHGFDMDKFLASRVVSDFMMTDATILNVGASSRELRGISEQDYAAVSQLEGLEGIGRVYLSGTILHKSAASKQHIDAFLEQWKQNFNPEFLKYGLESFEKTGEFNCSLFGIEEFIAGKLTVFRGDFDWQEFISGDYVLCSPGIHGSDSNANPADGALFQPGERVQITWPDGTQKAYTIMAVAELPYAIGPQFKTVLDSPFIFSSQEFLAHAAPGALNVCYDVADAHLDAAQDWTQAYCDSVNPALDFASRKTYETEYRSMTTMVSSVGGALAALLGLIGVLNFINACITSIYTRRRELAMLQSVGMTGAQLQSMLVWEGIGYIGYTLFYTVTLGSLACWLLCTLLGNVMDVFTYRFTLLPVAISAPVLLAFAALVPYLCYRSMCRDSMVERLRQAE